MDWREEREETPCGVERRERRNSLWIGEKREKKLPVGPEKRREETPCGVERRGEVVVSWCFRHVASACRLRLSAPLLPCGKQMDSWRGEWKTCIPWKTQEPNEEG